MNPQPPTKRIDPPARSVFQFIKRNALMTLVVLGVIFLITYVLNAFFEPLILKTTNWIVDKVGFTGLMVIQFLADTLISPIPPDLLIVIIAKSDLSDMAILYIGILSVISVLAGYSGYWVGRMLGKSAWGRRSLKDAPERHALRVKRYGIWAIIGGALTPLPFSVTCWTAGLLKMPWKLFALAALSRIPRFYIYYWVVRSSMG
jgi:membrane protein YqaA with SNARE-associated domain